jgi:deoxyadenosine/deoxycytidine kinase
MPTVKEYNDLLKNVALEIRKTKARRGLAVALRVLALVKDRIQRTGENSEGQQFEDYVTAYSQRRKKDGYQVAYVDFTRTGRLWNNITPQVIKEDDKSVNVEVRARDQRNQDKLDGQFRKRGNILLPNEEEEAFATELSRNQILEILDSVR